MYCWQRFARIIADNDLYISEPVHLWEGRVCDAFNRAKISDRPSGNVARGASPGMPFRFMLHSAWRRRGKWVGAANGR